MLSNEAIRTIEEKWNPPEWPVGSAADYAKVMHKRPFAYFRERIKHLGISGKLAFDEDRTVRVASPVLGRVSELVAQPGSTVKAGDVLAWLDSPDFAQARADARKAQADFALKRKALDRT